MSVEAPGSGALSQPCSMFRVTLKRRVIFRELIWRMKLITVYKAFSSADAQLIRSRLDASGFHAVVQHELSALSMEGYSMAAGGILVQVPETEVQDARNLLDSKDGAGKEP